MKPLIHTCALISFTLALIVTTPAFSGQVDLQAPNHSAELKSDLHAEIKEYVEAHGHFLSDLGFSPKEEKLTITVLSSRDEYDAYKGKNQFRSESPRGFYAHDSQQIVTWETLNGGISSELRRILAHETFHHMIHANLGHNLPLWLDEGLAVHFENAAKVSGNRLDKSGIHRAALSQVRKAQDEKTILSLTALLDLRRETFYQENPARNYAQAWSLVYFLMNEPSMKGKNVLGETLNGIASGKDQVSALTQSSGLSLVQLESAWQQFNNRL